MYEAIYLQSENDGLFYSLGAILKLNPKTHWNRWSYEIEDYHVRTVNVFKKEFNTIAEIPETIRLGRPNVVKDFPDSNYPGMSPPLVDIPPGPIDDGDTYYK